MKTKKTIATLFIFLALNIGYLFSQVNFNMNTSHGCYPLNVIFTNTTIGGKYFQWYFGDGQTDTTKNPTHTFIYSGKYTVILMGYNSTGQYMGESRQEIKVEGANKFIFYPNDTVCPNETFYVGIDNQYDSIKWDFGDGILMTHNWPIHSFSTPGTYNITLNAHTQCGFDQITQQVTVTSAAVPTYPYFNTSGNQFCVGDAIPFRSNMSYYTYHWDFDDGNTSSEQNPLYSYSTLGFRNVTLQVTNVCGNSNSAYANVDIANNVPANAYFGIPNQSTCPNEPISFNAPAGTSFYWDFGDGNYANTMNTKYVYGDTGTYTAMLIVTNGCGNSDTSQKIISINYNPSNSPYIVAGFTNNNWNKDTLMICTGEEIAFQSWTHNNGSGSISLLWDFGDGTFSEEKDPVHAFNTSGINLVTVIATNNCNGSDTVKKWVVANPYAFPVSNLNAIPNLICPGEKVYFFDDGNRMLESGYDYSIWFGDGDSTMHITAYTDTLIKVVSHQYNNIGSYIYTFTVTNACGNTNTLSDTIVVENNPLNEVFYYTENSTSGNNNGNQDQTGCPGDAVTFMIVGGVSYEWHFGDGNISTENFSLHTYADTGTYNAFVIATNACGRIDTIPTVVSIGNSNTPNPWFNVDEDNDCAGDTIVFTYSDQSGAASFYSYYWDFRDGITANTMNASHVFTHGGEYNVKLVVINGCGRDSSFRLIRINNPNTEFTASQHIIQENGTIIFTNLSQNATSYSWDFGDGATSAVINPTHTYTTQGIYLVSLTATSPFGCSSTFTDTIFVNNLLISSVIHQNNCYNSAEGYIDVTVTGGLPPYSYQWYHDGILTTTTTQDFSLFDTLTMLNTGSGVYEIVAIDENGMSVSESYNIVNPPQLTLNITTTNEICGNDGSITANVSGGTAPYSYCWSDLSTNNSLTNLAAGFHLVPVTVTDANGCTINQSITANINPGNYVQTIFISSTLPTCGNSNGKIWFIGTSPNIPSAIYTFQWNDPLSQTNDTAFNLSAGIYQLILTNTVTGCATKNYFNLNNLFNFYISNLNGATGPTCHGGNNGYASANVVTPTSPVNVEWGTNPIQYGYLAQNLTAGTYTVTATDVNGCKASTTYTVYEPDSLKITMTHTNPLCYGGYTGNATANISGGTPGYSYHWNNGSPYSSLQNRNAGTYYVTVTDNNSCTATSNVTLVNPMQITATSFVQDVTFYSLANGSIDLTPNGGTPPYVYIWSNGKHTQDIEQLYAGTYSVTIHDSNNCSAIASLTVGQPAALNVTITSLGSTTFCFGNSVVLDAGSGYLQYHWSNGATTQTTVANESGYYSVQCLSNTSLGVDSIYVSVSHPYAQQELCLVTVDSSNHNMIIWEKPTIDAGIVTYKLYKETNANNVYELLTTIPYANMTTYLDTASNPAQQSERYRISVIDTCGNESDMSTPHKTMHLTVSTGVGVYNLIWENYEGFVFPTYTIYRGATSNFLLPIGAIQSSLTTFTDYQPIGTFYYRIAVMKGDSCWASGTAKDMSGPFSQSLSNIEDNGIIFTGINSTKSENHISVFPNPFSESTMVYFTNNTHSNYILSITDVTGKIIRQIKNIIDNNIEITKGDLSSGFYMIELKGDKTYHQTIVVE